MTKKILVDAAYPEETRIAITENGRLEDFDYSTVNKKNLKGGIYLAIVTRVEPSLQAAFIDYGGDKHGFIPFAEIHPDYYNIPVQDKQEILEEAKVTKTAPEETAQEGSEPAEQIEKKESEEVNEDNNENDTIDEDQLDAIKKQYIAKYKIQEVIKRNQIILVQAIKEERGNKGAFFTSYISLAGRYCVIMPNSHSAGGISRKVSNGEDRKRLKVIVDEINNNNTISVIIRTIGQNRTKDEILRDYSYLTNLWDEIRQKTLSSTAPAFIHAEDDLIKRIIRDLYDDETDEIVIQGRELYNAAKNVSKVMVAGDEIRIREYKEKSPLFSRYKIDEQISNLYNQVVYLESGGYIVINHTEALIAVDVNSGKATSERNVEETAIKTNMEAAREVCRQIKLRNLSGLIVIDFIDMMELRNKRSVEKIMRDAFYNDRAKTQIGNLSSFGLLEMSRQRLKPSFLEHNTVICSHCNGKGVSRSLEANALMILRTIESEICRIRVQKINIYAHPESVMFILNNKRKSIHEIESKYNVALMFLQDNSLSVDSFAIENIAVNPINEKLEKSLHTLSGPTEKQHNNTSTERPNKNRHKNKQKPAQETKPEIVAPVELPNNTAEIQETPVENIENPTEEIDSKPKSRRRPRPRRKFKKPDDVEKVTETNEKAE